MPLVLEEPDGGAAARASTRRSSPTRTAPPRRSSPRCARPDVQVVDLSADFRLRDLPTYERWYGEHGAPELLDGAVYGLTELNRERDRRRPSWSPTPAAIRPRRLLALAPLAEAGPDRGRRDRREVRASPARAAAPPRRWRRSRTSDDTRPYKVAGHRHAPEIAQELAALGRRTAPSMTFVPHLLPFDQGELVSCYVRTRERARARTELDGALRRPLRRRSRSSSWSTSRRGWARSARRTSAGSTSPLDHGLAGG